MQRDRLRGSRFTLQFLSRLACDAEESTMHEAGDRRCASHLRGLVADRALRHLNRMSVSVVAPPQFEAIGSACRPYLWRGVHQSLPSGALAHRDPKRNDRAAAAFLWRLWLQNCAQNSLSGAPSDLLSIDTHGGDAWVGYAGDFKIAEAGHGEHRRHRNSSGPTRHDHAEGEGIGHTDDQVAVWPLR